jgi:hypothetical protein
MNDFALVVKEYGNTRASPSAFLCFSIMELKAADGVCLQVHSSSRYGPRIYTISSVSFSFSNPPNILKVAAWYLNLTAHYIFYLMSMVALQATLNSTPKASQSTSMTSSIGLVLHRSLQSFAHKPSIFFTCLKQ